MVGVTDPSVRQAPTSVAALVRARADDDHVGLVSGDSSWTWRQVVAEAAARAAWMSATLDEDRPRHVGVLLPNTPEFVFNILGAALAGTCIVGLNPTRRGAELVRDIDHTACQFVLSDATYADLIPGVVRTEDQPWIGFNGTPLPTTDPPGSSLMFLLLTSGSTSAPKATKWSQQRFAKGAAMGFGPDDALYCPMPLFHGNALNAAFFPALVCGAQLVLREKFSATAWLDDVRRYGITFTATVGRALGYVLATPPTEHDRDHRLKMVLAPEASPRDIADFPKRFGVPVVSGYGSSEGGIVLMPNRKAGSLGTTPPGADIAVVDASGVECVAAEFDSGGRLVNAEQATGELVRRDAGSSFEGYWDNEEADADRVRDGWFWSGDLAYRDADGVFWFAGRVGEWLRVDSENFAAAPVERIVVRFDDASAAAVVGVPDPLAGEQVLAAIELTPGKAFDPAVFTSFLDEQTDLGTKWVPKFVRICPQIPVVGNGKINRKALQREAWLCADDVWWRPGRSAEYVLMTDVDRKRLRDEFVAHGREDAHPKEF